MSASATRPSATPSVPGRCPVHQARSTTGRALSHHPAQQLTKVAKPANYHQSKRTAEFHICGNASGYDSFLTGTTGTNEKNTPNSLSSLTKTVPGPDGDKPVFAGDNGDKTPKNARVYPWFLLFSSQPANSSREPQNLRLTRIRHEVANSASLLPLNLLPGTSHKLTGTARTTPLKKSARGTYGGLTVRHCPGVDVLALASQPRPHTE